VSASKTHECPDVILSQLRSVRTACKCRAACHRQHTGLAAERPTTERQQPLATCGMVVHLQAWLVDMLAAPLTQLLSATKTMPTTLLKVAGTSAEAFRHLSLQPSARAPNASATP
jgi:hypothetical protein